VCVRRRTTSIDGVINQAADSYFTLAAAERNPGLVTGTGAGGHLPAAATRAAADADAATSVR
jgi:GntR family transcriptional regulator